VTSSGSDNAGHVGRGGVDVDRELGEEFQESARLRLSEAAASLGDQQDLIALGLYLAWTHSRARASGRLGLLRRSRRARGRPGRWCGPRR